MGDKVTRIRRRPVIGSSKSSPSDASSSSVVSLTKGAGPRAVVKALVVEADEKKVDGPISQVMPDDPFRDLVHSKMVLAPPLDPRLLTVLWEQNSYLGPCIATMAVNCESFGHQFTPRIQVNDETPKAVLARMEEEKLLLDNWFNNCVIEGEDSFTGLRMRKRQDEEGVGYAAWEVVEFNTEVLGFNYVPAHTVRCTGLDKMRVRASHKMLMRHEDGTYRYIERPVWKRFRKFVQVRGSKMRWFKEYGDPRTMNAETGEYVSGPGAISAYKRANSILFFVQAAARTPYGIPRYIGSLLGIYGSRATDEINFFTFESNNVPSMAVTVSNGMLSDGSVDRIQQFVEKQASGQRNYSRFLILEAEPATDGLGDPGRVALDIQPLTDQQRTDAMFLKYKEQAKADVRGAFRLPDVFFGEAPQGGAVGAMETMRKLTDEQVFLPERNTFDDRMNRRILPALGVVYWQFKSNTPETTDNKDLIRILAMAEKSGGVSPAIAREIMSRVVGHDLGKVKGIDPEVPYTLQVAQAQKTGGDPMSTASQAGTNSLRRMGATTRAELGLEDTAKASEVETPWEGEAVLAGLGTLVDRISEEQEGRTAKAKEVKRERPTVSGE